MDGLDIVVGKTIQFRRDFGDAPMAGFVTAVGNEGRISCHVFVDTQNQPDIRTGVMHSSHPKAKQFIEMNEEGGIWDYVELLREPPEIDLSKQAEQNREKKPAPAKPKAAPKPKKPTVVTPVGEVS